MSFPTKLGVFHSFGDIFETTRTQENSFRSRSRSKINLKKQSIECPCAVLLVHAGTSIVQLHTHVLAHAGTSIVQLHTHVLPHAGTNIVQLHIDVLARAGTSIVQLHTHVLAHASTMQ